MGASHPDDMIPAMTARASSRTDEKFSIALVQMACGPDPDENLDRAAAKVEEAAKAGVDVVCLPELFRSQYFCQKEDTANFDLAEPVPGPTTERLGEVEVALPVELAVGPERGWSPRERELLREAGFRFVHLGERVLRVETAVVAAVSLVRARLGLM